MSILGRIGRGAAFALASAIGAAAAMAQQAPAQAHTLLGTNCDAPPILHCPDSMCESDRVTQPGNTVEPRSRRTFFLDCPRGYTPGAKVTLVLALHGGGSYANWQRNYAPFMDVKDKYNLVIMTPGSPTRVWTPDDDQYLQNIVDLVVGTVGKANVDRFILAGHSQGGMTSNRIICTPYFRDKVDVRVSLSGGRIGPTTPAGRGFGQGGAPVYQQVPGAAAATPAPAAPRPPAPAATGPAGGDCDYSFIFTNGEYESIPQAASPLADRFGCGPRQQREDVVDPRPGYVWDATRQDPGTDGWGHYPRSGRAQVFVYPNCRNGRVIADVVRLQKGHTEGLEPNVTDMLMQLATSAAGGKIQRGSWNPPAPPPPPQGIGGPPRAAPAPAAPAPAASPSNRPR
jgi:poly(3-hydroxybutyrate) depolymerase